MSRIKIMLADDHIVFIQGLMELLQQEPDFEMMGYALDGRALVDKLRSIAVDVVVMDLNMPRLDGIRAIPMVKQCQPRCQVLVLSSYNQPELMKKVEASGASGFLMKNCSAEELKHAIRQVRQGEKCFQYLAETPVETASYFMDDFLKKYNLTKREVEIIRQLARGLSSKEICDVLKISSFTVDTHRRNILKKLNVSNTVGVVQFAKTHGLIE